MKKVILLFLVLLTTSIILTFKNNDKITNSRTIKAMKESNLYQDKYKEEYLRINYEDITNFAITINELLDKKYNYEEINYILANFKENLNILLDMDYIDLLQFRNISNFDINNIKRYIDYKNNNNYDIKTVVTYVNIGLDLPGYSNYTTYKNEELQNDLSILVNKYHKLPNNYIPNDLETLYNNEEYQLRKEAKYAFETLTSNALLENVVIYPFSAYRSYETQEKLYKYYKNKDGEKSADTYSARPGFSEHQLGLAIDIRSDGLNDNLTYEDYNWMLNNSYKYGFIVRYPKGKQEITSFIEEPWHLRYLGIELATKVHESRLTYDEYYDLYLK